MCGIIAAFNIGDNKEDVTEDVKHIFQDQRSRGTDGFGIISFGKDHKISIKRSTEETALLFDLYVTKSPNIILHHRRPTSSENKIQETHPMLVSNKELKYDYLLVHNGIIMNDEEMKEKHEDLGYKYTTERKKDDDKMEFNDSESLAIEVSRFIENKSPDIEVTGSAAFVALAVDKKTSKAIKLYYGRWGTGPLKLAKNNCKIRLSSEGEGDDIKEDLLYSFDFKDHKIKKTKLKFTPIADVVITKTEDKTKDTTIGVRKGYNYNEHGDHGQSTSFKTEDTAAAEDALQDAIDEVVDTGQQAAAEVLSKYFEMLREPQQAYYDEEWAIKDIVRIIVSTKADVQDTITDSLIEEERTLVDEARSIQTQDEEMAEIDKNYQKDLEEVSKIAQN